MHFVPLKQPLTQPPTFSYTALKNSSASSTAFSWIELLDYYPSICNAFTPQIELITEIHVYLNTGRYLKVHWIIKASMAYRCLCLFYIYKLRPKLVVRINQCSYDKYNKLKLVLPEEAVDEDILVFLLYYKLQNER